MTLWHIAFDVLDRLLSGTPIGPIVAGDAMKFARWQRLNAEYAKQFGIEAPKWPPKAAQEALVNTAVPPNLTSRDREGAVRD